MPHHLTAAATLLGRVVATSPPDLGTMGVSSITPVDSMSSEEAEQFGEASFVHGEGSQPSFRKCYSFKGGSAKFLIQNRIRGSKFPEIDMFKEVYVRHEDELTEQLHVIHHGGEGPDCSGGGGFPTSPRDPDRGGVSPWESPPSGPVCLLLQAENRRG
ncbi:hypothetical protein D8674_030946 [Pyrus ussuriensis x Pyrus communis]|uniref:Uncharacterized protein n=1 Tax=Pyrus ussuriensis x Pyrus communis TaxID=2448454 RepID=A0A5N5EXE9_9ROSA|nr:hypothetical protein D8674_030946 [Pyrus ussuriensis x Pyrus communis]